MYLILIINWQIFITIREILQAGNGQVITLLNRQVN